MPISSSLNGVNVKGRKQVKMRQITRIKCQQYGFMQKWVGKSLHLRTPCALLTDPPKTQTSAWMFTIFFWRGFQAEKNQLYYGWNENNLAFYCEKHQESFYFFRNIGSCLCTQDVFVLTVCLSNIWKYIIIIKVKLRSQFISRAECIFGKTIIS